MEVNLAGKMLSTSESSRIRVTRNAMQMVASAATQHQTSPRRCVTSRAMKSLIRMSEPRMNTNRHQVANPASAVRVSIPETFLDNKCSHLLMNPHLAPARPPLPEGED